MTSPHATSLMSVGTFPEDAREANERCNVQIVDTISEQLSPFEDWMRACGLSTLNAAANSLAIHRHTAEAMRGRPLTKIERLAMAAIYHRIKPFDRS